MDRSTEAPTEAPNLSTAPSDFYVYYGAEIMRANAEGYLYRPSVPTAQRPSGFWRIVGAIEYTRNGLGIARRWTWTQIAADPSAIPWRWRNGNQRVFVQDIDHGTLREWRSPRHSILR